MRRDQHGQDLRQAQGHRTHPRPAALVPPPTSSSTGVFNSSALAALPRRCIAPRPTPPSPRQTEVQRLLDVEASIDPEAAFMQFNSLVATYGRNTLGAALLAVAPEEVFELLGQLSAPVERC